jgi:hypothetical protein
MDSNIDTHEPTKSQGTRRKNANPVLFEKLDFAHFVKECWTPKHNDLGRLAGAFVPLMNFAWLPLPCADLLADLKSGQEVRHIDSFDELMWVVQRSAGCIPDAVQIAACLVWCLYREWRLYQLYQLWLDGYEFPAQPHLFPLNWAMPIARLVERIDFREDRTKTARALCHRTKNLLFTSRFTDDLLERYVRRFDAACARVELGTSGLALQEPSHVQ